MNQEPVVKCAYCRVERNIGQFDKQQDVINDSGDIVVTISDTDRTCSRFTETLREMLKKRKLTSVEAQEKTRTFLLMRGARLY